MVKADAYNHGLAGVVDASRKIVDRFGVATLDEAIKLRMLDDSTPISMFSYEVKDLELVSKYNITPVIYNENTLKYLFKVKHADFDLKVDSGMNRFGFNSVERCKEVVSLLRKEGLCPRTIMTHFSSCDFIEEQIREFYSLTQEFRTAFPNVKLILSASNGIERGKYFDGVRAGLIAYKNALTVKSNILDVKEVLKGGRVGYDGLYKAENDTRIAVISGGYYDGIKRSFSGASVIINGSFVPIVGRICMDTLIVDLKDVKAKINYEVEVLSSKNLSSFLKADNTTNEYELLTSIKGRAKREYIYNGKRFNSLVN